jgi:hypothetical protein
MSQRTFNFTILFSVWLVAAAAIGSSGVLRTLPRPALQIMIFGLTAILLISYWNWRAFREFVRGLPIRVLIVMHVTRLIGIYFVLLYKQGKLPWAFAVPGGLGDIAVAATAIGVCCLPLQTKFGRQVAMVWNALGLFDILCVVGTAAVLGARDPMSMLALTMPPLALLATFLVPLIIASHVILFERLLTNETDQRATGTQTESRS